MKKSCLMIPLLALGLLAGCAEYREYSYRDYPMSREQMHDGVMAILSAEGYTIVERSENFVKDLPQTELVSDWNLHETGGVYRGNDRRRKVYVTITTLYTERTRDDFQPLSEEDGERYREREAELKKKAELEHTRLGIAVNRERRDAIDRPLEADWIYEGPDNLAAAELMGRFEAFFGAKHGGGAKLSPRGEKMIEEDIRNRPPKR